MRGGIISNNEKQFILKALDEDQRVDGRRPLDVRRITFRFSDDGRVEVSLGRTRILAVGSCEIVEPHADRPAEGMIHIATEFSPMAKLAFDYNRPLDDVIAINRVVEKGIKEAKALDTEALCIISGRKVWNVRIDLRVLDCGGNLVDAASFAAIAALLAFRVPEVSVQGEEVKIYSKEEREPVPLCIHHVPIAITFAFFSGGTVAVLDPSEKEEQAMDGTMTVMMNAQRELCGIFKGGGIAVDLDMVKECVEVAGMKAQEIDAVLRDAIKQHNEARLAKRAKPPRGIDIKEPEMKPMQDAATWRDKLKRQREEELRTQGPSMSDMMVLEGLLSDVSAKNVRDESNSTEGDQEVYSKLQEAWKDETEDMEPKTIGKNLTTSQLDEFHELAESLLKSSATSQDSKMVVEEESEEEQSIIQESSTTMTSTKVKKAKKVKKQSLDDEVDRSGMEPKSGKKKKKMKKQVEQTS